MTFQELKETFRILNPTSPHESLTAHIIFAEDGFTGPYRRISRPYRVSSGNTAFRSGSAGYSILTWCLDRQRGQAVRLDTLMSDDGNPGGWKVQDCYIQEDMPDAPTVRGFTRTELEDGMVRHAFGCTRVRVRETFGHGGLRLEPLSRNRTRNGNWKDLPIDEAYRYCTLLQRYLNATAAAVPASCNEHAAMLALDVSFATDGDFRFNGTGAMLDTESDMYEGADMTYRCEAWATWPRKPRWPDGEPGRHPILSVPIMAPVLAGQTTGEKIWNSRWNEPTKSWPPTVATWTCTERTSLNCRKVWKSPATPI